MFIHQNKQQHYLARFLASLIVQVQVPCHDCALNPIFEKQFIIPIILTLLLWQYILQAGLYCRLPSWQLGEIYTFFYGGVYNTFQHYECQSIRGKSVAGLDLFVLYYKGQIFLISLPNQLYVFSFCLTDFGILSASSHFPPHIHMHLNQEECLITIFHSAYFPNYFSLFFIPPFCGGNLPQFTFSVTDFIRCFSQIQSFKFLNSIILERNKLFLYKIRKVGRETEKCKWFLFLKSLS